jgi:hypothetical protein
MPPIYYLAMITLVKCELWLAQGRTDLADAWLTRLGQTYNGDHAAAAPEFHRTCRNISGCSRRHWMPFAINLKRRCNGSKHWRNRLTTAGAR